MMDLTPLEVRKKKGDFRRQIRGYDPATVDDFLDLVADRLEQVVRENHALAERTERLEQQVSEYREREKALTEALVSAQQMREAMRVQAVQDADQARSQAAREADQERTQAAREADSTRQEARETLEKAQKQAAREVEQARAQAEGVSRRILAELRQVRERESAELRQLRERESAAITRLQAQRVQLLQGYRALLERSLAELEAVHREVEGEANPPIEERSAPLQVVAAGHEMSVLETIDVAVDSLIGPEEESVAEAELLLEESVALPAEAVSPEEELVLEDVEDDNAWLAELAAGAVVPQKGPAPQPSPVTAEVSFLDDAANESDEEFIDLIMAEAAVPPVAASGSRPSVPGPTRDQHAAEETVLELGAEDLLETLPAEVTAEQDDESGFDAMFGQDDDLGNFDFDAALATATGVSSQPNRKPEAVKPPRPEPQPENVIDLEIDLNETASPLDLGRRSMGAFDVDDFGIPPKSMAPRLSRAGGGRPPELTLRPLSPEEDAPDLPAEARRNDDGRDDDMFSSMFGGRG